jgi:hypothetical protein
MLPAGLHDEIIVELLCLWLVRLADRLIPDSVVAANPARRQLDLSSTRRSKQPKRMRANEKRVCSQCPAGVVRALLGVMKRVAMKEDRVTWL